MQAAGQRLEAAGVIAAAGPARLAVEQLEPPLSSRMLEQADPAVWKIACLQKSSALSTVQDRCLHRWERLLLVGGFGLPCQFRLHPILRPLGLCP